MHLRTILLSLALVALVITPSFAQNEGGLGDTSLPGIDVDALNANITNLGVQYLPLTNTIFVSSRGSAPGGVYNANAPHTVYEIDLTGTLVNEFAQQTTSPVWGHRDMATDGFLLFAGDEGGVYCFDNTGAYQTTPAIVTANGPAIATFPIVGAAGLVGGTARGLAYNPAGNMGNGSFWTANFASAIVEFDLAGNVLNTLVTNNTWSVYGLAWDPYRSTLWVNSSPNAGDIVEVDPATGMETGTRFVAPYGGIQGGLCWMERAGAPYSELLGLSQGGVIPPGTAAIDAIWGARIDRFDPAVSANGDYRDEPILEGQVNALGFNKLRRGFSDNDILSWHYNSEPTSSGLFPPVPGLLVANVLFDADNAITPGIPELYIRHALSIPAAAGASLTLGDGFGLGGLLAPNAPLGPNLTGSPSAPGAFTVPPGIFTNGDQIRLQAFVLDIVHGATANPVSGLATNSIRFAYTPPVTSGMLAEATGTNSFNADPTSGFFRFTNLDPVKTPVSLQLDWVASTNAAQATMEFDTDQIGMLDRFDGGNSAIATCLGTYRNGSDATVGLDYTGTVPAPCDAGALSGWIGTNAGAAALSWRTLDFAFTAGQWANGEVFEFDADTDGGAGVTGGNMVGLVVTVVWDDNSTSTMELAADPNDVNRSLAALP